MSTPNEAYKHKPVSQRTLEDLLPAPRPQKKAKRAKHNSQQAAARAMQVAKAAEHARQAGLTDREIKFAEQRRKSVKSLGYYLLSGVELAHADRVNSHLRVANEGATFLADAVEWGIRHAVKAGDQGDDAFPIEGVLTRGQEILDVITPASDTPVPLDSILSDTARVWLGMVK